MKGDRLYFREGYLYQVSRPFFIETGIVPPEPIVREFFTLHADGWLNIKQGYAWDGATWAPEWLVPPDCSCTHDALCQMLRLRLLDYTIFAPMVHGLLGKMVAYRRGAIVGAVVRKAVTAAKGGHPDNTDDNPEVSDPP